MTQDEIFQTTLEELARNCDACSPPELDNADLEAILTAAQVATVWQANTEYAAGTVIVPDLLSAMSYRAVAGGTTGATAPAWPDWSAWGYGGCCWGGNPSQPNSSFYRMGGLIPVTDGGVTWIADGPISALYDIDEATARGWQLKAAKAADLIQTSSAGQSSQMQQIFSHARQLAIDWQPFKVA